MISSRQSPRKAPIASTSRVLAQLFTRHPLPMVLLGARTFDVLAANEAACYQYGYTSRELHALPGLELWHDGERERFTQTLAHLSFAWPLGPTRWRHRHKDGSAFEAEVHAVDLGPAGGVAWLVLAAAIGIAHEPPRNLAFAALDIGLRSAIERGTIDVAYQPIVDLDTERTVGFEALARWNEPERGPIAPDVFIPLAEATGLIGALGMSILDRACARLRALVDAGHGHLHACVNVSAHQLGDPAFAAGVIATTRAHGIAASALTLEITETAYIGGSEIVLANLAAIRAANVRVALDDFGTGYSALGYLKRLSIDAVKIDRSFIADIMRDAADRAITRAILAVCESLGLDAIAEGVEHAEQLPTLVDLGARYVQGYLFSPALPAATFAEYVAGERIEPILTKAGLTTR